MKSFDSLKWAIYNAGTVEKRRDEASRIRSRREGQHDFGGRALRVTMKPPGHLTGWDFQS
jgi:hypothetical protein